MLHFDSGFKRNPSAVVQTFKTVLPSTLSGPLSRTTRGNDINVTRHSEQDVVNSDRSSYVTHIICMYATHLKVTKREEVTTNSTVLWIAHTSRLQALRSHTRVLTLAPNLFLGDQVEEIVFTAFFITILSNDYVLQVH